MQEEIMKIFTLFSEKAPLSAGFAARVQIQLHQYDIIPNSADTIPGDHIIILPAKEPKTAAFSRDNNGKDLAADAVYLHILYKPHPAAITNIDDLLIPKLTQSGIHSSTPPFPIL